MQGKTNTRRPKLISVILLDYVIFVIGGNSAHIFQIYIQSREFLPTHEYSLIK